MKGLKYGKMKKLIIASNNQGKIKEIKEILAHEYDEILSLKDAGINAEIEENGKSFYENAKKKAVEVSKIVSGDVMADDSGLCVESLDGAPGIYSARYAGEHATDEMNNNKLIKRLKDKQNRKAKYVCAIVIANGGKEKFYAEESCEGIIKDKPKGENGFGYDPYFYDENYKMTFAQLDPEIKNKISHRAKALKRIKSLVKDAN